MKILAIHNRYQLPGGEDQSHAAEMKLTRDRGHEVHEYLEDNARVADLGRVRTAVRTVWSGETYRRVRRRLAGAGFDVVHVQNFFPLVSPSVYYAARSAGVAVVQAIRNYRLVCPSATLYRDGRVCDDCCGKALAWPGVVHRCYRGSVMASATVAAMLGVHRGMRTWTRAVDAYVAPTAFVKEKVVAGGLPADKVHVKPNIIFPAGGELEVVEAPTEPKYVVFVGRLAQEKGLGVLLDAYERLRDQVGLKVLGDGPIMEEIKARTAEMRGVELLGRQSQDRVQQIVRGAVCLVAPAQWYEPFGRTMVEAFVQGVPVVAADQPPTRDIVRDGHNGFLFDPGSAAGLVDRVRQLCADPTLLAQMKRRCREDYEARFSPERNYEILMRVYEAAIETSRRWRGRQGSTRST